MAFSYVYCTQQSMFITDLKNNLKILIFISLIGLLLRFLYFPSDVYFGYDQARDAYYIQDIIHGHLKVLGPPSTASSLYHGVLSYYILAPFYYLSEGNPLVQQFLFESGMFWEYF